MNKRIKKKKLRSTSNKIELGNLIFGNSRGAYPVPREWQGLFCARMSEMGFDFYGYMERDDVKKTDRGGFENEVFMINPYYWGDDTDIAMEPNFVFKENDFRIDWYKYPLRDSYSNMDVTFTEFATMLKKCVKSININ